MHDIQSNFRKYPTVKSKLYFARYLLQSSLSTFHQYYFTLARNLQKFTPSETGIIYRIVVFRVG